MTRMATARTIERNTTPELDAPAEGELRAIWGAAIASFLCLVVAEVCLYLEVFNHPL